jgi:N-acetylated-alpha-linked acidic dipeptidase
VYCAWDGEEPALLGSTEWVEDHAAELQQKAVVYINTDGYGRGFLDAGGSQALEPAFTAISKSVMDPQTNVTVFERKHFRDIVTATSAKEKKELMEKTLFVLPALGSGSDFSPFAQHIGVPSINLGFGGEDNGGEYHSIYDSYDFYKRFKDPGFVYGVALAKTAGRTTLRFADAEILPFDFRNLQTTINAYVKEIIAMADEMRENTVLENKLINEKYYAVANRADAPLLAPAVKTEVPFLNFASLQNAVNSLEKSTNDLNGVINKNDISAAAKNELNKKLYKAEQVLLTQEGLPRRGWYKHVLYAPGFYTGYGVKTLPGVREAIEQRNWKEAQEQIEIAAVTIDKLSAYFESASSAATK